MASSSASSSTACSERGARSGSPRTARRRRRARPARARGRRGARRTGRTSGRGRGSWSGSTPRRALRTRGPAPGRSSPVAASPGGLNDSRPAAPSKRFDTVAAVVASVDLLGLPAVPPRALTAFTKECRGCPPPRSFPAHQPGSRHSPPPGPGRRCIRRHRRPGARPRRRLPLLVGQRRDRRRRLRPRHRLQPVREGPRLRPHRHRRRVPARQDHQALDPAARPRRLGRLGPQRRPVAWPPTR